MTSRLESRRQHEAALEAWATRVVPRAVAYARTLLALPGDAEDVVHDVLCRLFGHKEYDLIADGERLLFRSVTNACINRATRQRNMINMDKALETPSAWSAVMQKKPSHNPVDLAAAGELHEAIQEGLTTLSAMQRAALELKSMRYSLNDIADMLNVSQSNAAVLVHRARRKLSEHLSPFLSEGSQNRATPHVRSRGNGS